MKIYRYIVYNFSIEIILICRKFEEDIECSCIYFFMERPLVLTLYTTVVHLSEH